MQPTRFRGSVVHSGWVELPALPTSLLTAADPSLPTAVPSTEGVSSTSFAAGIGAVGAVALLALIAALVMYCRLQRLSDTKPPASEMSSVVLAGASPSH